MFVPVLHSFTPVNPCSGSSRVFATTSGPRSRNHFAFRYFLARELQQRGQLRLAYVASEANTADIFTKALAPGDHQRFCALLACFALLDWSCDLLFSPTLPMGVCQAYML
ncbi:unnamed protein product [Closterium sp. NIES-53]